MSEVNVVNFNIEELTLSEIVKKNFKAAAIFESYDLDFCCRGNKQIQQACAEKGISYSEVMEKVLPIFEEKKNGEARYDEWEIDFLADYIVNNHHEYVRRMIPVIAAHTQKVAAVHGDRHPEVIEIANKFSTVYKDLKQHLMKEEQILFPYIKQLKKISETDKGKERPFFGTASNPIKMMESEHEAAGDELFEIRRLSNGYTPPEDACNTYRVCFQELKDFEEDLHKHVHLENNILFPKTISLENEIFGS